MRRRVGGLHARCHAEVEAVHREVRARRREDAVYIVLAIALMAFLGAMGEGPSTNGQAALTGPGGQLQYRCTALPGDNPSHGGCNPPIAPTLTFNTEGTLQTNRPADTAFQPARRIETINRSIDALDDFLFSNPDPAEWTAEERDAFGRLVVALEQTCEG